jgi:hypothetical protein
MFSGQANDLSRKRNRVNLNFEGKVFLHIFHDHDEVWQLDAQGLPGVGRAGDVRGADVGADDLQDKALDVWIRDPLDVAIPNLLVPDLQRLAPNAVQNGEKSALESVFEHPETTVAHSALTRPTGIDEKEFIPAFFSFFSSGRPPSQEDRLPLTFGGFAMYPKSELVLTFPSFGLLSPYTRFDLNFRLPRQEFRAHTPFGPNHFPHLRHCPLWFFRQQKLPENSVPSLSKGWTLQKKMAGGIFFFQTRSTSVVWV